MIKHERGMIYRVACPDRSWFSEPYGRRGPAIERRDRINRDVIGHSHDGDDIVEFSRDRGKTWETLQ